jgi:hypothetical protein
VLHRATSLDRRLGEAHLGQAFLDGLHAGFGHLRLADQQNLEVLKAGQVLQTGVALDASASMKNWYGRNLTGSVPAGPTGTGADMGRMIGSGRGGVPAATAE